MNHLTSLQQRRSRGEKSLAVLVDPDKSGPESLDELCDAASRIRVDYFFVGSSLLLDNRLPACVEHLKNNSNVPVLLFPGNSLQVCNKADAILYLSLISGRNADFLIGQHVLSAPHLKSSGLEVIPTGYMLIDCGHPTSVTYMSQTLPIPHDKNDIAVSTAVAGELLGLKLVYLDAGSGARLPVSTEMIEAVREAVAIPVITGGGIRTPEKALQNCLAGADVIVVGNAVEKDPSLIAEISNAVHSLQTT
jgi:putative glycerol-1-phosphate prenyltransferase